jgi:hypothetical protein
MRVQRHSNNWRSIDHKLTDRAGNVIWTDIPARTYRYRVLENRKGGDFWGMEKIIVPSTGTRTSFFQRKLPYIIVLKKPSLISKGKRDPITIVVSNKETHTVSAKVWLRISEPTGKGSQGYEQIQGPLSIQPDGNRTFQFYYSPRDTGRNYVLLTATVLSKYRSKYLRTDTRRLDWYVTVEPGANRSPATRAVRSAAKTQRPTKPAAKQEIRAPTSTAEKKPAQEQAEETPIPLDKPTTSIRTEETIPEVPASPVISPLIIIGVLFSISAAIVVLILLRAKISRSERSRSIRRQTSDKTEESQPQQFTQRDGSVGKQVEDLEKLLWIKRDEHDDRD